MVRYVGIDLHKHLLVACILDERGTVTCANIHPVATGQFPTIGGDTRPAI
jgi:hypothetical protein